MANLKCNVGGIQAPNPFWLASAPPTDKIYNVERAFEDFVKEVVPESFVFIGANAKKIKLYDAIAKKILRKHSTYKLERKNIMPGKVFFGSRELIKYGFRRKNVIS